MQMNVSWTQYSANRLINHYKFGTKIKMYFCVYMRNNIICITDKHTGVEMKFCWNIKRCSTVGDYNKDTSKITHSYC